MCLGTCQSTCPRTGLTNLNALPSLATWTHKLGSKQFVEEELEKAFQVSVFVIRELIRMSQSWAPYTNLKFEATDDYHEADIRVVFGRYDHGDRFVGLKHKVECSAFSPATLSMDLATLWPMHTSPMNSVTK